MDNIEALEQHYQQLLNEYQADQIDEETFIAEVDQLQFQDEMGRYWMIGAQSGNWHYFDGHAWHQADPREADKLPIMDENGIYWQRGAKSGAWYYYDSDNNEWLQPPDEAVEMATSQAQSYDSAPQPHINEMTNNFDGELFQDEEGRYWTVGAKSGKWYFFDDNGWHPADALHDQQQPYEQYTEADYGPTSAAAAAAQPTTQSYPAAYSQSDSQPYMPQQQPPVQVYVVSPGQDVSNLGGQQGGSQAQAPPPQQETPPPASAFARSALPKEEYIPPRQSRPVQAESATGPAAEEQNVPPRRHAPMSPAAEPQQQADEAFNQQQPPVGLTQQRAGGWFYFDGERWLQYSPEQGPPPDTVAPQPEPVKKPEKNEPPVVAEVLTAEDDMEDDEDDVVEVEVITVVEAEPDEEEEPPVAEEKQQLISPTKTPPPASEWRSSNVGAGGSGVPLEEDVKPRRATQPLPMQQEEKPEPQAEPQAKAKAKSLTPAQAREKGQGGNLPVFIPTGDDPTSIRPKANRPATRPNRPVSRPVKRQPRRERESTIPMNTQARQGGHRQPTQPIPQQTSESRTEGAAQPTAESPSPVPMAAAQTNNENLTLGEFLRAFPSTMWSAVIGLTLLLLVCAGLSIGGGVLSGTGLAGGVAALPSQTPTLDTGVVPDTSPTAVPTATPTPALVNVADLEMSNFSEPGLGFSLDYPQPWETELLDDAAIFSPSAEGLDPDNLQNSAFWIGQTEDTTDVADLLADVLSEFPLEAEVLTEGSISIASHVWTSVQIRFEDENLGGEATATLAVTIKDDTGYYLVATAPADEWNNVRDVFQEMINSFQFTDGTSVASRTEEAEEAESEEDETPQPTRRATATEEASDEEALSDEDEAAEATEEPTTTPTATPTEEEEEEEETPTPRATATPTETPTPRATPTPTGTPMPLTYEVQSGDTLSRIAAQFGVDMELLIDENGLTETMVLNIGQELVIPFTAEELEDYYRRSGTPIAEADEEDEEEAEATATTDEDEEDDETEATEDEEEAETAEETEAEATETAADEEAETDAADEATPTPEAEVAEGEPAPLSGRIVYPAFDAGAGTFNLWLADLDTDEQSIIAGQASQPAFSRDGGLLAYRSWDRESRGIIFRDFIGGRGGQVTKFVEDSLPTWSPDGGSFVFASRREGDRVPRLFRATQRGNDAQGIPFEGVHVDVLADGRLVSRGCLPGGQDCGLYVTGPQGSGPTRIGTTADTAPAGNGSKIAFMSSGRGASNWEIWVINADGSDPQRLTENGNQDGLPTWSPDGQSIAYVSDQGGVWGIWVMNADGSNQRKLFNMQGGPDGTVLVDTGNSKGWLEERISWAP